MLTCVPRPDLQRLLQALQRFKLLPTLLVHDPKVEVAVPDRLMCLSEVLNAQCQTPLKARDCLKEISLVVVEHAHHEVAVASIEACVTEVDFDELDVLDVHFLPVCEVAAGAE
jgi:hypothetical protein